MKKNPFFALNIKLYTQNIFRYDIKFFFIVQQEWWIKKKFCCGMKQKLGTGRNKNVCICRRKTQKRAVEKDKECSETISIVICIIVFCSRLFCLFESHHVPKKKFFAVYNFNLAGFCWKSGEGFAKFCPRVQLANILKDSCIFREFA